VIHLRVRRGLYICAPAVVVYLRDHRDRAPALPLWSYACAAVVIVHLRHRSDRVPARPSWSCICAAIVVVSLRVGRNHAPCAVVMIMHLRSLIIEIDARCLTEKPFGWKNPRSSETRLSISPERTLIWLLDDELVCGP